MAFREFGTHRLHPSINYNEKFRSDTKTGYREFESSRIHRTIRFSPEAFLNTFGQGKHAEVFSVRSDRRLAISMPLGSVTLEFHVITRRNLLNLTEDLSPKCVKDIHPSLLVLVPYLAYKHRLYRIQTFSIDVIVKIASLVVVIASAYGLTPT
jgi:hypothetical protein